MSTDRNKKESSSSVKSRSRDKTGVDVVNAVRDMIASQYPGMNEEDATRLAVMLAKAQIKGEI